MANNLAALNLGTAIYTRITGDSPIMARLTGGFHEDVPENEVYPYLLLDDFNSTPWRTLSRPGEDVIVTFRVFSEYEGSKETQQIVDDLQRLFGDVTGISVTGWLFAASWFESFGPVTREERSNYVVIRNTPVRYRMKLQNATGF